MHSEYSIDVDARSKSRSRSCDNGKKKAIEQCFIVHSEAPKAICEDAPRERRDVSRVLRVQARARQQRGCIHSPAVITPSSSHHHRTQWAKTSARPRGGQLSERLIPTLFGPDGPTARQIISESAPSGSKPTVVEAVKTNYFFSKRGAEGEKI
jgi:hypothetical protein